MRLIVSSSLFEADSKSVLLILCLFLLICRSANSWRRWRLICKGVLIGVLLSSTMSLSPLSPHEPPLYLFLKRPVLHIVSLCPFAPPSLLSFSPSLALSLRRSHSKNTLPRTHTHIHTRIHTHMHNVHTYTHAHMHTTLRCRGRQGQP